MPDTVSEYRNGDIFLLAGSGLGKLGIGDFRNQVRRLEPRMAALLPPGWFVDSPWSDCRGDIFKIDSSAFVDVLMGQWYVFTFGGLTRSHCGLTPNDRAVRTLSDAYRMAGLEIAPGPIGAKQIRTVENTTWSVISIASAHPYSVYGGDSHIPFPHTPVVRGIGIRRPATTQGNTLTTLQRAVVLGGPIIWLIAPS